MKNVYKILVGGLLSLVLLIVVAASVLFVSFSQKANVKFERPQFSIYEEVTQADVELGKRIYMVRSGCVDCHGTNLAGMKIMDNPAMGSIYGVNITPYKVKSWSDEDIAASIRYGIHKSGRSLRFMPSFDFESLSKSDVAALIAFMRSVPEVQEESHENSYGPVAKILALLGKMPVMFPAFVIDQSKGFAEKPAESATVEFGKYLANSCVGCHGAEYRGGKIPGGDPAWPEASNIRMGADANWDEGKFREMVLSGKSPKTGQVLRAPMPIHLLKQLNEIEVKALWMFLSSLN